MIQKTYTKELAQNVANVLADCKTVLPKEGKELVIPGARCYHIVRFCSPQEYEVTLNIPN